jgi:hypothetical protein
MDLLSRVREAERVMVTSSVREELAGGEEEAGTSEWCSQCGSSWAPMNRIELWLSCLP